MIKLLIKLAEDGLLPDMLIRLGIRRLCTQRLLEATSIGKLEMEKRHSSWIDFLN